MRHVPAGQSIVAAQHGSGSHGIVLTGRRLQRGAVDTGPRSGGYGSVRGGRLGLRSGVGGNSVQGLPPPLSHQVHVLALVHPPERGGIRPGAFQRAEVAAPRVPRRRHGRRLRKDKKPPALDAVAQSVERVRLFGPDEMRSCSSLSTEH